MSRRYWKLISGSGICTEGNQSSLRNAQPKQFKSAMYMLNRCNYQHLCDRSQFRLISKCRSLQYLNGIIQKAGVPNLQKKAHYYPNTNAYWTLYKHLAKLSPFMENVNLSAAVTKGGLRITHGSKSQAPPARACRHPSAAPNGVSTRAPSAQASPSFRLLKPKKSRSQISASVPRTRVLSASQANGVHPYQLPGVHPNNTSERPKRKRRKFNQTPVLYEDGHYWFSSDTAKQTKRITWAK